MKHSLNKSLAAMSTLLKTAGAYIDDAAITAKVKAQMAADKNVRGLRISVTTIKGVVQLGGFAHSKQEAKEAAAIARAIAGVNSVNNDIHI